MRVRTERRFLAIGAILAALIVLCPELTLAEQQPSAAAEQAEQESTAGAAQLTELEQQLRVLGARVDELGHVEGTPAEVIRRLEERLDAQAARIAELEGAAAPAPAETAAAAETPERRRLEWTRGEGLVLRPLSNDSIVLGLRGFLWARYDGQWRVGDGDTDFITNEFSIPETRIRFMATFADGLFHFVVQPSLALGRPGIQDGYLELRLHPAAVIRFGQQLVPYDWESNTSPPQLPLNGLGPLAARFGHARDLGLMVMGTLATRLHYRVGAFNGSGRGAPSNDNTQLLVAAMLRYQVLGTTNPGWGWSDIGHTERPALAVRLGFSYDRDERTRELEEGSELAEEFTMASVQGTADVLFRWRGASLAAVYYFGADNQEDVDLWGYAQGWLVHAGYFVWRERLELLVRYTSLDQDIESDEGAIGHQLDAGLTFFLVGHHARITGLYKFRRDMPGMPEDVRDHAIQIEARGWF